MGKRVTLGLRPERIVGTGAAGGNGNQTISCRVDFIEPTGPDTLVFTQINGVRTLSRVHPDLDPRPGQMVDLAFDLSNAVLFDPQSGARIDRS
jgi:multiple sugar transport system ATP-binding protein